MRKIISFLLVLCLLVNSCVFVFAEEVDKIKKAYYTCDIYTRIVNDYQFAYDTGDLDNAERPYVKSQINFLIRQQSEDDEERLYLKAEDIVELTNNKYQFKQTQTEFAYVCDETCEVVRFEFNSDKVVVLFADQLLEYEAPFEIIYEDGVAWVPYEFIIKLFQINQIESEEAIILDVPYHTYFSAVYEINKNFDDWRFDWVLEANKTQEENFYDFVSSTLVVNINKLVSLEPAAWGSLILAGFGNTYLYDAGYARKVAKAFIEPALQEVKTLEDNWLVGQGKDMLKVLKLTDDAPKAKIPENATEVLNTFSKKIPSLLKNSKFQKLKNFSLSDKAAGLNKAIKEFGKDKVTKTGLWSLNFALEAAEFIDYYYLFVTKSERSVDAMKSYASVSGIDEANVFANYVDENEDYISDSLENYFLDNVSGGIQTGLNLSGVFNGYVVAFQIGWTIFTSVPVVADAIKSSEFRLISDYGMRYQDDCVQLLNIQLNKVGNGSNDEELDTAADLFYSFLKFSYISRDAAVASLKASNEKKNADLINKFNEKNYRVAGLLTAFEEEMFSPTKCDNEKWDDSMHIELIKNNRPLAELPIQESTPVADISTFPGAEPPDYITAEEAEELVAEVMDSYSAGFLTAMSSADIYSFEYVDDYLHIKKLGSLEDMVMHYVIQMKIYGEHEAYFLVPMDGSAVYLTTAMDNGTYYYLEADLLNMSVWEIMQAIGKEFSNEYKGQQIQPKE